MSNASASHLVVQTGTLVKLPAFFYSGSGRALSFVLALLFTTVSVRAQTKIRSLTNVIEGHAVGGVTVDLVGNIYVADFGEYVWKITPEGKRDVFASGFGSWMERPQRRGSLSLTESPILRGDAGFTSTSMSTIQSLHCRAVRSSAKLRLRQPSSCFYALTDYTPIRTNQIHEKLLRHVRCLHLGYGRFSFSCPLPRYTQASASCHEPERLTRF
jgi:hypothetical protein